MDRQATGPFALIVATKTTGKIIETALRRNGMPSVRYESASAALQALDSPGRERCCIAYIDLAPLGPSVDGYELIQLLRSQPSLGASFRETVFVALPNEGQDTLVSRIKARMVGAREYLPKPFDTRRIVVLAQRFMR